MEPGRATHTPPPFPDHWCGLWKDPSGRIMYIRRMNGRQLEVSFTAGIQQHFYPLESSPFEVTRHLPGIYLKDHYGAPILQIDIGVPNQSPRYDIHFIFGEGNRLRPAEPWDMVSGVIARPKLALGGRPEQEDNTEMSWAYPLSNYWKADEEEMRFRAFHAW
jgi:hypothetical protein